MSSDIEQNDDDAIWDIFFREDRELLEVIEKQNTRFVHYTTAESAMKVLQSNELWMRKSNTMNDYMEVDHGVFLLQRAYEKFIKSEFSQLFDPIFPGFCDELANKYDSWLPDFRNETYLACLSIHDDAEDDFGRLSMWRAYGGQNGVAIVLNNSPFISESNALHVYSSKVNYSNGDGFDAVFHKIISKLNANRNLLPRIQKEIIIELIFHKFLFSVICTKHSGFKEENEWRILHNPILWPSKRVNKSVEIIRGIPQQIIKVPFKSYPEEGLSGLEIESLVDRIIIGPAQYPVAIKDAFIDLLSKCGVKNPEAKVHISHIPLRI